LLPLALASAQTPLLKAPANFQVELVLQAPDIEAPTALCVAPNGDVYYAEDPMDMRGPTTKNIDKIWMLKGGDPKKKVLIAEQMWAVMGLEIVRDQLFVVHPPYVTVFSLDAEGKAAGRTDLFTDLGPKVAGLPGFNDHICSGIRMGADGWLYVSIGDKGIPAMTRKEKDQGSVHVAEGRWRYTQDGNVISLEGGGVIRFKPDGSKLEVFACGTRNHLDVPLDEHDRIFVRDNTDDGDGWNTRFMYLPRGGFLGYPWGFKQQPSETVPLIHDFGGGSPCQGWVYLDDGLPATYRGRVFHAEWGRGKIYAVKLKPSLTITQPPGAGFEFVDEVKFLDPDGTAVKDFRPYSIRPTADGRGFYVTDWAFSGWTSKTVAGRLWKVTYTGDDVKPEARIDTTRATLDELAKALGHPAHSQRIQAQRELIARVAKEPAAVEKALKENLTENLRLYPHVVWVEAALPEGGSMAVRLLASPDVATRLEAVRVLADREKVGETVVTGVLLNRFFLEQVGTVRLQLAAALRGRKIERLVGPNLIAVLQQELDPWVRQVLARYFREKEGRALLIQLTKDYGGAQNLPEDTAKRLCWLLPETFDLEAVPVLVALLKHPEPTVRAYAVETLHRNYKERRLYTGTWWGTRPEQQKPPPREVAWAGTPTVREAIVSALADRDANVRTMAVRALVAMKDPVTFKPLRERLEQEKDTPTRVDLIKAIAGLQSSETPNYLRVLAADESLPEAVRVAAIAGFDASLPRTGEFLGRLTQDDQPVPVRVAVLETLARVKPPLTDAVAAKCTESKEVSVRKAALQTLAALGEASNGKVVRALVTDPDPAVRLVAIQTLAVLKDRDSVPALLQAMTAEATQFDALLALAQVPDKRAVAAYLLGLASKNAQLRQSSAQALAAIREEATPILEQLVKRNEVSATLLPELRAIYSSFEPIGTWALIGPFPADKIHIPADKVDLSAKVGDRTWRKDQKADLKNHGKVDLAKLFTPSTEMVAYGHVEIDSATERPATLLIGSDDTMRIWLNGERVFEFTGSRGWSHNSDKVNVKLKQGKNTLLIECGNHSGPWEFSVALSADVAKYAFLQGGSGKLDLEAYRAFARKTQGDAVRGKTLFLDVKGVACAKCHALGGQGGKVGPALDDIGLKYKREELMTSILEPSRTIANGYESIIVTLNSGKTIVGVFKGETPETVNVMDDEGRLHEIAKKDIEERALSPISRMPNGLNEGMTLQDFADIVAFLETCREVKPQK
jgi:putative heme-binding domain-containing protein